MPAKSRAQQRLMQAAEHGASFPMARKIRASMTHSQMHDFASGSEKGKPMHVPKVHRAKGPSPDGHINGGWKHPGMSHYDGDGVKPTPHSAPMSHRDGGGKVTPHSAPMSHFPADGEEY